MTNEKILANAPEHCFAVDHFIGSKEPVYICSNSNEFYAVHLGEKIGTAPNEYPFSVRFRSLSDIRSIVELEKEVERLKAHSLIFDAASALNDDLKQKLEAAERERDELRCAVATAIDVFDDYDMDVETYAPIKHVQMKQGLHDCLNKFAIEQQIKALEREASLWPDDLTECSHVKSSILGSAEELRQQLNGSE